MSRAEAHIRSLSMSRYVMVIDATKCMNCKACLVACQQRNHVPLGHARNWVRQTPDVSSPLGFAFQPGACMHCDKPLCVDACPTHATYKADDGSVVIDKSRCIGCGSCARACPYEAPYVSLESGTSRKCDFCMDLIDKGETPYCVAACPMRCLEYGDIEELRAEHGDLCAIAPIPAETGTEPNIVFTPNRLNADGAIEGITLNEPQEVVSQTV